MKRIVKGAIALTCLSTLALTGCTSTSTSSSTSSGGSGKTSGCASGDADASGKPSGTITFQTTNLKSSFGAFFNKLIADFEKQNPGVTVKWIDDPGDSGFDSRILAEARSCDLPDVMNLPAGTVSELNKASDLLDFDKVAPGAGKVFVPSVWDSVASKTHAAHPALPWYWGPSVQVYNKELWAKAGLSTPPTSVTDLLDDAAAVGKASGGKFYAITGNRDWDYLNDWQSLGVKLMNDDQTKFTFADDPKAVNYVNQLRDIYQAGGMRKDSVLGSPDPSNDYAAGNLVWGSSNASFLRYLQQNAPKVYAQTEVAPYPANPDGTTPFNGQYVSVPVNSKHQAAAIAFARFLTNDANQLAWAEDPDVVIFPTTTAALKNPFFTHATGGGAFAQARAVAAKEALNAKADPAVPYFAGDVDTAIQKAFQQAITGQKSAADALKQAEATANASLHS